MRGEGFRFVKAEVMGAWLSVLAALLWLLAAAIIAWTFGTLLTAPEQVALFPTVAVFFALWGLRTAGEAWAQRILSAAADARIAQVRAEVVEAETLAATQSGLGGAGALAAMMGEKLEALRPYLMRYRPARLRSTVVPLLILAISAWHSWAVALVLLFAGPLIPMFMALVGWAAKEASARQMGEVGALSDLLVDRLSALGDLRLIGAGPVVIADFADASDSLRQRTMAVLRIAFLSSTVLELFSALGVAMVAIWVGFSLLGELDWGGWGRDLSPVAGVYLLLLAPEFFQPLRDLAAAWHDRAAAEAVLKELEDWRVEPRGKRMGTGKAVSPLPGMPVVRFEAVAHHGVIFPDFQILPGDTVALLGQSGAGKSTILRLLAGLECPDHGRITLDGAPLDDDLADRWRAMIGWMPQAPHFLNRSLRYNLGFGARLNGDAVAQAQLSQVLDRLPRGDLTLLGERGAGLSGGEARRVTLARALNGAPQVLLADEPTADLDAVTAADVIDGLMQFAKPGGTLVIATHDPALARRMSRQIVLQPTTGAA